MPHPVDLASIALALPGTTAKPHFDRTAYRVKRIFMTVPQDGLTANLKLTPDDQELRCTLHPLVFSPVPNAWGKQGWTTMTLAQAPHDVAKAAIIAAHANAL